MKAATLEAVRPPSCRPARRFTTTLRGSSANTGTFFAPATVPADCTFILAAVTAVTGIANGYASLTMPKGGVDTAMVRLTGGDTDGRAVAERDVLHGQPGHRGRQGASSGIGPAAASVEIQTVISLTFWKGVDTTNPIRDSAGVQMARRSLRSATLWHSTRWRRRC